MLSLAFAGRQILVNRVGEDQKTQIVLERLTDMRQHEDGIDGVIKLGKVPRSSGHHSTYVQTEDDVLAVLAFEDGSNRLAAASGRFPVYVTKIIVNSVVAEMAELTAGAGQSLRAISSRPNQGGTQQRFITPDFQKIRINLHRLRSRDGPVNQPQAHRSPATQPNVSELKVAPLGRHQLVGKPDGPVRRNDCVL